ncbi:MAG: nucleoside deaminase [Sphingobium sp.]|nr:nucleoside deaminase [Sphingobium sp.]
MSQPFPLPEPMRVALDCARAAGEADEVPIGAVVTREGAIIATGENRNRRDKDPTAHAEIVAMRAAARLLGTDRLTGCDLWVTLEPCPMCAGAIAHARIGRLYYGALDPKAGGVEHGARVFSHPQCHHRPELFGGIGADVAGAMLRDFFAAKR